MDGSRRPLLSLSIVAGIVAAAVVFGARAPTWAQSDRASLPSGCSSGQVVVSDGFDRFRCVEASEVLRLGGCSSGDLVSTDTSGRLRCGRPSGCTDEGVVAVDTWGRITCLRRQDGRHLLPECPRGASLVSSGDGRWSCSR